VSAQALAPGSAADPKSERPVRTFEAPRRQWLWRVQHRYAPYLFVAPFVVLFCVFLLYPLISSISLSLHKAAGPANIRWVGLNNYRFLFADSYFWIAVGNTMAYAAVFLPLQIAMSLGLALLLNSRIVRLRNYFRFAFFAPVLVGQVFVAVIFSLLLAQRHGLVNRFIGALMPWVGSETNWIGHPTYARPAVVIASLWLTVGYGMVYFLAALQAVDRDLYEAAEVDGAGRWSQFWHVTLPGIRPVLMFMVLVGTIGALQLFELPYVLFQGAGPNQSGLTVVMYLFMQGFDVGDIGYASAVGWMLVVMIFVLSLLQLKVMRGMREDRS
jgi:ABC-type sugar transport system permease subunit